MTQELCYFLGSEFIFLMVKATLGLFSNNFRIGQWGGKIQSPKESRVEMLFQPFKPWQLCQVPFRTYLNHTGECWKWNRWFARIIWIANSRLYSGVRQEQIIIGGHSPPPLSRLVSYVFMYLFLQLTREKHHLPVLPRDLKLKLPRLMACDFSPSSLEASEI